MGHGLHPGELVFYTTLCGLAVMLPMAMAMPEARRSFLTYRPRHAPVLLVCGLLGLLLYNYLIYYAFNLDLENVIAPAVINYLWPMTTLVFSVLLLGERLTRRTLFAAGVAFGGFVVIQTARLSAGASLLDASAKACLLAFLAAVSWGLFSALARRAADRHGFHPLSSLIIYQAVGVVASLIISWQHINPLKLIENPTLLLTLAVLGIGANGIANMTWLQAMRIGGPSRTTVVAYLTPVLSLTYIAIFLGQRPQWYALLGLAAILAAITVVRTAPKAEHNIDLIRRKEPSTG